MKISTKGRYALRLMMDLAENNSGSPISLKDVAKRQDISDKYLEQIISILNKAGYVRSVRGAQGGYMLKMEPQNYTVGMILRQTEGSLAPVACIEDDEIVCDRQQQCVTSIVYKKINDLSERKSLMPNISSRINREEISTSSTPIGSLSS